MNDRNVEPSNEHDFGLPHVMAKSMKFHIQIHTIETFSKLELSQYGKSGSTFSQSCAKHCPKSLAINFSDKAFDCLLELPLGVLAR